MSRRIDRVVRTVTKFARRRRYDVSGHANPPSQITVAVRYAEAERNDPRNVVGRNAGVRHVVAAAVFVVGEDEDRAVRRADDVLDHAGGACLGDVPWVSPTWGWGVIRLYGQRLAAVSTMKPSASLDVGPGGADQPQ